MAGFKALSMGGKAAVFAGGAALAALASYGGWALRKAPPMAEAVSQETVVAQPTAAPEATDPAATVAAAPEPVTQADTSTALPEEVDPAKAAAPPAPEIVAPVPPVPVVPSFDVVRVEPDGSTVVAGRAEPGAKIVLQVDGAEISAVTADANGNFVGLFVLESSQSPRMLTMTSILPDQTEIPAAAEVALAPTVAPLVVAAAEPAVGDIAATSDASAPATAEAPAEVEGQAPAALLVTKDGVNVLQSGAQSDASGPVADVTVDSISYTPSGEVQLAGRGDPSAVLRVYLDNAPLIDVTVGADGRWASTMPKITPGIYTLRVDSLAADGSVTARFETPFKRETQEALAVATQLEGLATEIAGAISAEEQNAVADQPAVAETLATEPALDAASSDLPAVSAETTAPEQSPAAQTPENQVAAVAAPVAPKPVSITVQPGFTLWGIASEQFGDGVLYVQVFEANKDKIRDPNLIYPGQVFVIPKASE